jgi:FMN-dependent NADH-azoreductase
MPTLLRIDVSPRGDYSVSKRLADAAVTVWQQKNPHGTVVTRNLSHAPLPVVDLPWIAAAYSTPDQHTPEQKAAIKVSDDLVAELFAADEILIATPMFNFSLPAALKSWIDHVVRMGRTVNGKYEGLVKGKKVFVLVASGGVYDPGSHSEKMDFFTSYMKFILGFIGLTDTTIHFANGTGAIAQGKVALDDYLKEHEPKVVEAFTK